MHPESHLPGTPFRSPSMGVTLLVWEVASHPLGTGESVRPRTGLLPTVILETLGLGRRLQVPRIRPDSGPPSQLPSPCLTLVTRPDTSTTIDSRGWIPTTVSPSLQDPLLLSGFTLISGLTLSGDRWAGTRSRQVDPVCPWEPRGWDGDTVSFYSSMAFRLMQTNWDRAEER